MTKKEAWNDQTGGYLTSTALYDAYGNMTKQTDPRRQGATPPTTRPTTCSRPSVQRPRPLQLDKVWDTVSGAIDLGHRRQRLHGDHQLRRVRPRSPRMTTPSGSWVTTAYQSWGNATTQQIVSMRGRTAAPTAASGPQPTRTASGASTRPSTRGRPPPSRTPTRHLHRRDERVWKKSLPYATGETPVHRLCLRWRRAGCDA